MDTRNVCGQCEHFGTDCDSKDGGKRACADFFLRLLPRAPKNPNDPVNLKPLKQEDSTVKRVCRNCRNFWYSNSRPCGCEDLDDTCPAFSYADDAKMFNRTKEWRVFAALVEEHVEKYTIPQYGDAPDDQIEAWECAAVVRSIGKRAARQGKNSRENQDALDLLKIAHEACVAYFKLTGERPYEEVSDED